MRIALILLVLASLASATPQPETNETPQIESPPELLVRPIPEPPAAVPAQADPDSARAMEATGSETLSLSTATTNLTAWIGGGMSVYNGKFADAYNSGTVGYAVNVSVLTPLDKQDPLWIGADLGVNVWQFDSPTPNDSLSASGIQTLATMIYQFPSVLTEGLHPYVGVSAGPNFYFFTTTHVLAHTSDTNLTVYMEVLFRPGVLWEAARGLSFGAEPKFGVLGSDFIFLPLVTMNLSL